MAGFDLTAAAAVLKRTYADGIVELSYDNCKTLAIMKKTKGVTVKTPFGEGFYVPVKHGNPQAGSATYGTAYAQTATEFSRYKSWAVTPATLWRMAQVNGDAVRRGEGVGSFVTALTDEIENTKDAFRRDLELFIFRGKDGSLGQISSASGTSTTVTLAVKSQVRYFEVGMSLVAAAALSSGGLRSATPIKVIGRNISAGTLTMAAAISTQSWAAGDYLFRDGDRNACLNGMADWLPTSAPSATLFNGIDRTIDDRLGGLRVDAAVSGNPEEAFFDATVLIDSEGGTATHGVMGPDTFGKTLKSLSNRIQYVDYKTDVGVVVPGFRIPGNDTMFYSDGACPEGLSYLFNTDELELRYAGKDLLSIVDDDGLTIRRVAGSDDWRVELVSSPQIIMPAPGHAAVVYNL